MLREKWDLCELVMKLNGPIQPTGVHEADRIRLSNLKALTDLIDDFLREIQDLIPAAERPEHSMKEIGMTAQDYLNGLRSWLQEVEE